MHRALRLRIICGSAASGTLTAMVFCPDCRGAAASADSLGKRQGSAQIPMLSWQKYLVCRVARSMGYVYPVRWGLDTTSTVPRSPLLSAGTLEFSLKVIELLVAANWGCFLCFPARLSIRSIPPVPRRASVVLQTFGPLNVASTGRCLAAA